MNPAAETARRLPGVRIWYGRHTGSWWAYLPGRPDRLVEAADPHQLARALVATPPGLVTGPVTAPWPRPYR